MKRQKPYFNLIANRSRMPDNNNADGAALEAEQMEVKQLQNRTVETYCTKDGAVIAVTLEQSECSCVVRQTCEVKNATQELMHLTYASSLYYTGIGADAEHDWDEEGRFIVHSCQNIWQGEGQWRHASLAEMGLYNTYNHMVRTTAVIQSIGSWTTGKYYPIVMLEDTVLKKIWFFELEAVGSWQIEIGANGENAKDGLCVSLSCANENLDGWCVELIPGEVYSTIPAFYGVTDGGFEEAVRELTRYKRESSKANWENNVVPVCFNDYMDCLWGMPSLEREIPLIDAAAKAGAEVFCIDAGWYCSELDSQCGHIGDYKIAEHKFGKIGLRGLLEYIRGKGMRAGVWLEMESCEAETAAYEMFKEGGLLSRYGHIIGGKRAFFDFRNSAVRAHFLRILDDLYAMGVRYIKNDYNQSIGIGCDSQYAGENALSESMREAQLAFLDFIAVVREMYPDLILENCGSGAMRSNHAVLSNFWLQSTSDQEFYEKNPSIISGSMACMAPEKAGIWSYPYPVMYRDRMNFQESTEWLAEQENGLKTVSNMTTAMLGCIYLSGRIDRCDEKNAELIREAIAVYKDEIRAKIPQSVPVYPTGTFRMTDVGVQSFGLLAEDKSGLILAVWNLGGETEATIDVSKYLGERVAVRKLYPSLECIQVTAESAVVNVKFPAQDTAVLVWVERA